MILADGDVVSSVNNAARAGIILDESCLEQSVSRQNCCFELSQSSVGAETLRVVDAVGFEPWPLGCKPSALPSGKRPCSLPLGFSLLGFTAVYVASLSGLVQQKRSLHLE